MIGAIILNAIIVVAIACFSPIVSDKEKGISKAAVRILQLHNEQAMDSSAFVEWAIGWSKTRILLQDLEFYTWVQTLVEQGTWGTFIFPQLEDWRMGFPFYCQRGHAIFHSSSWVEQQSSVSNNASNYEARGLFEIRPPSIYQNERAYYIPLYPIWWGWLLNVAIYAMLLAYVTSQYKRRWGRAARRRKKGICPQCAYDLRGDFSVGCPECGWGRCSKTKQDKESTEGGIRDEA
ncbi:MAG: hypothetical protein IH984_17495 [Planctomycetes bacterium]|nr:hypothetical protein [Planctomycetota bacterium]